MSDSVNGNEVAANTKSQGGEHILLTRLREQNCNPRQTGTHSFVAKCPHRDDSTPSLAISLKQGVTMFDRGRPNQDNRELQREVCASLGISPDSLLPRKQRKQSLAQLPLKPAYIHNVEHPGMACDGWKSDVVFRYFDEDYLRFEKVKFTRPNGPDTVEKTFRLRRLVGQQAVYFLGACRLEDGTVLDPVQKILYRLNELLTADPETTYLFTAPPSALQSPPPPG